MQILCFFLFFYSRAAVSVVFSTLLSCSGFIMCSFLHHVFLSEQIKMMMMKYSVQAAKNLSGRDCSFSEQFTSGYVLSCTFYLTVISNYVYTLYVIP